ANESSTTPVIAGDHLLASSISFGMVGLKGAQKEDGSWSLSPLWKNPALTCYFSTPIPVGDKHVYVVTGQMSFTPTSSLHCVEIASGKILWSVPKVGKYHAAMLRTGNGKILLLSDLGDLILFQPNPEKYEELAKTKIVKGEGIWAHPALVDGRVFFRDDKELYCVQMPR
ncbi:MAG: hypothetical protein ACKO23_17675, partial [Gemmataceae bacterium]